MLLRNTAYNLIGLGAPLLVAVVSIPVLISALGPDRFGLLTLIWAVVSYFGLFDMGLGRALTLQLSVAFADGDAQRTGPLVATSTLLMAGLGIIATVVLVVSAEWGVGLIRAVPDKQEAVRATYAMALAMPAIVLTSGFRGVLEAGHAFKTINLIRLPMGIFTFLGPVAVVAYGVPRLDFIAMVLVAGRVVACAVHGWFAWRLLPANHGPLRPRRALLRPLLVTGGWLTTSNVVSPLMGYVDRFAIGAIVSASAVAYYATPNELVTKLWIVPGALTAVLFPTFAVQMARSDAQTWPLFARVVRWLTLLMLPPTLLLALYAHELLSVWIDIAFADQAALLLQIFSIGVFVSCLAQVPFTLIQSAGNARATALIHCAEFPFYLIGLWYFTSAYGTTGAALIWLIRIVVDTLLMFMISRKLLDILPARGSMIDLATLPVLSLLSFAGMMSLPNDSSRLIWVLGTLVMVGWSIKRSLSNTKPKRQPTN
jgi:O-antigen/teichoic acid export membrane protein